jgi:hypothetical protein
MNGSERRERIEKIGPSLPHTPMLTPLDELSDDVCIKSGRTHTSLCHTVGHRRATSINRVEKSVRSSGVQHNVSNAIIY